MKNEALETENIKFIWGLTSLDDLSGTDASLDTFNDIDIIYYKDAQLYLLSVETAYSFKNHKSACNYLKRCLDAFTQYMDSNGLQKNVPYDLFLDNLNLSHKAGSIEELYVNFKIFVDGFCNQDVDMEEVNNEKTRKI